MRHLHYVEIENFKRFGNTQRIELDHPAVLIGPNNSGKTSVIQALALWSLAVKTWVQESDVSDAEKRQGKALNRLKIMQVPVPKTRYFWHNLRVTGNLVTIRVGMQYRGQVVAVGMTLKHHSSDELVYCQPEALAPGSPDVLRLAAQLDVALLYPMSGIAAEEPVILPNRIDYHIGRGSTAEVLRNLCLNVHKKSPEDWKSISHRMQTLFGVDVGDPQENEQGAVDLLYVQPGTKGSLDISMSGRGFQQILLMLAYLYSHRHSVLLIDEPDAHLEILRQKQVYILLREIAEENLSQVILVTHSEVILDEALESNLTFMLEGKCENLARKPSIQSALRTFGTAHYVKARECGYVLYVEGSTDIAILRMLAEKLDHPVLGCLDDRLNSYYVQDTYSEATVESELLRVEGGFGLSARQHFFELRKVLPELTGLAILDNDGKGRADSAEGGLQVTFWKRYEIENYFIRPAILRAYAESRLSDLTVFGSFATEIDEVLDSTTRELVFGGSAADFSVYKNATPDAARLLWDSKTERLKLSEYAEEFFRRLSQKTAQPMLLRKTELHRLVGGCEPAAIPSEVRGKLDLLHELFTRAKQASAAPTDL